MHLASRIATLFSRQEIVFCSLSSVAKMRDVSESLLLAFESVCVLPSAVIPSTCQFQLTIIVSKSLEAELCYLQKVPYRFRVHPEQNTEITVHLFSSSR